MFACAESDSAQANTTPSQIFHEYLWKQNHFSLFIRSTDGFDSWNKKMQKILWHFSFKVEEKVLEYIFFGTWKIALILAKPWFSERKIL